MEAEWAQLPPEEHEKGMRSHEQFHRDLAAGGHRVLAVSPLTPSERALSMRPDGSGGVLVTDGPFVELKEYLGGLTIIEAPDLDAALHWGRRSAETIGLPIEVRPFQWAP